MGEDFFMKILLSLLLFLSAILLSAQSSSLISPKTYFANKATQEITIDGLGDEFDWQSAQWTTSFVDIQSNNPVRPAYETRVKMLWDTSYLYFYAELEEPHVWAKITEKDAVIFYDNDFEVFIDADGDTQNYHELEINAFNTVWDLLITRPYRDGGFPLDNWNFKGLKTAVNINGTINNPTDKDEGWSVEIAIPWKALKEGSRKKVYPISGDVWRINFSRVQWHTEVINEQYVKKKDPETGKGLPEENWVWTPQRVISMHEPEFWGGVYFLDENQPATNILQLQEQFLEEQLIRQFLYSIHRAQLEFKRVNTKYAARKKNLSMDQQYNQLKKFKWKIISNGLTYSVKTKVSGANEYWYIDHTGRVWKEKLDKQ
jgi:hypothetical protein